MNLLISVRSVDEALVASTGGADFIDLKEPGQGALGGLPTATIREIVAALRARGPAGEISATIGDLPMHDAAGIAERVQAVGACGVDYVKVGIERRPEAFGVLDLLATCGLPVVPVFIADEGLDDDAVARACTLAFPALMVDTADKLCGSLFDVLPMADLRRFVDTVRSGGALVGLAGALRLADATRLKSLAPDFAGFRSAVCAGSRSSTLDPHSLQALVRQMREQPAMAVEP